MNDGACYLAHEFVFIVFRCAFRCVATLKMCSDSVEHKLDDAYHLAHEFVFKKWF